MKQFLLILGILSFAALACGPATEVLAEANANEHQSDLLAEAPTICEAVEAKSGYATAFDSVGTWQPFSSGKAVYTPGSSVKPMIEGDFEDREISADKVYIIKADENGTFERDGYIRILVDGTPRWVAENTGNWCSR